ncbi:MAG: crossover junction endodeoxyribonuclease RuvC [Deltaproteobacteria bacterium]|nr:crossover junction endodeoxyribonuclease RuvC [Deltaproteobacteria bacterium]
MLGVDPGTAVTGWGVIERRAGRIAHLAHGAVSPSSRGTLAAKLAAIHAALTEICAAWRPDVVVLERNFVGRNVQSAFRLGEVRGVAMLVAAAVGIGVAEYPPATVKLAVTGSGRAEKDQVQRAIARELGVADRLTPDAADALAIALCHVHSARLAAALAAVGAR